MIIGSASVARSIRIRFHFRHRTGHIRPALFRNAIERREASVDPNSGAPITQSTLCTFDMLRRMANPLSLLNWWLHKYDNEDDYALFLV